MGHRRCLYRDYPLAEGALVAEVCNLIYANLPENLQLLCEVQYSSFVIRTTYSLTQSACAHNTVTERIGGIRFMNTASFQRLAGAGRNLSDSACSR